MFTVQWLPADSRVKDTYVDVFSSCIDARCKVWMILSTSTDRGVQHWCFQKVCDPGSLFPK